MILTFTVSQRDDICKYAFLDIPRESNSFTYDIHPPRQIASSRTIENPTEFPKIDPRYFELKEEVRQQHRPNNQKAAQLAAELDEQRLKMQLASPRKSAIPRRRAPKVGDASQLAHKNFTFVEQLLRVSPMLTHPVLVTFRRPKLRQNACFS
jgi:hypothetical protein